jgi:subtilase family serine protease
VVEGHDKSCRGKIFFRRKIFPRSVFAFGDNSRPPGAPSLRRNVMRIPSGARLLLCAAVLLVAGGEAGETQGRAAGEGQVRRARRPVPNQYIVVLNQGEDPDQVGRDAAVVHGGRPGRQFRRAFRGFTVRLAAREAARLAGDPRVAFVEEDGILSVSQVQTGAPPNLDRIDQRFLPLDGTYAYAELGSYVRVHVVDTGVRISHQEFGGRAVIAGDYVDDDGDGDPGDIGNDDGFPALPDGADCHGHGTHVAGIIGGATYGVAKNVSIYSHRVLSCNGSGTVSGALAAIEAITNDSYRPAVVNMSLGGEPSDALDAAVRTAIQAGITFVVAAGNSFSDARNFSPARVAEAITVGATDATDTRAWFSNYGPALDLFGPGVSVQSAWYTGDTATAALSGTSMAAPHVTGVIAIYLSRQPDLTPDALQQQVVGAATPDLVIMPGTGSPNRLLHSDVDNLSAPSVALLQPNAGARILGGRSFSIQWQASDPDGFTGFDVLLSIDGGTSYVPLTGCSALDGAQRHCTWQTPGPDTATARVRVVATDARGDIAFAQSSGNFSIVTAPDLVTTAVEQSSARVAPGGSFVATDTVQNYGNASSGAFTTRYFLSLDSTKSANDIAVTGSRSVVALAPQLSSTGTAALTIPVYTAPGTYTLLACADASLTIKELDETNNCAAAASNLFIEYGDLVVTRVGDPPSSVAPGGAFVVFDTVQNAGAVTVSASWTRYYLSADTSKDTGDVLLSGMRHVPALAADSSSAGSTNVFVPAPTLPGAYRVIACADDTLMARETLESNNCTASAAIVTVELPDLATASVSIPGGAMAPGALVTVTDTVQNVSAVPSAASTTRYYLSVDGTKSVDDVMFTASRYVGGLAAGGASTGSRSVAVPDSTPHGVYRVLACADDLLKVSEPNESNNCRPTTSTITVALPDLAVVSLGGVPASAAADAWITVTDVVRNTGIAAASGWSNVRYYLSTDTIRSTDDMLLPGYRSVPALAPNAASTGTRTMRIPSMLAAGTYHVLACTDADGAIAETDETNNCAVSAPVTMTAAGGA